jgi:predicted DNA-binding transcriptional regulator AlpA
MPDRLWTHQETAEFLRISPAALHQMNCKKTGPRSFRVGRYRRYNGSDVLEWLASRASVADVRGAVGQAS